ncbi:hypothetical protein LQ327_24675 [Actinomycetospora endophytica]|uniref:Uncharacterized protein n=1 Tax=Actinomycetospora endophytica TaxID=2291215 RepID=A0ABS8PE84_9PSEU|nr:hypothetical protein [Actinomycetospora endophytica]MCD2196572.1 hypothetical protein [Actinomycetospora endophytica]
MRSPVLLLVGFGMVAAGAAIAFGVNGGTMPGIALVVMGLVVKGAGFLLGDSSSSTRAGGPQTLAGRSVERPRAGIPVGRAAVRRRIPSRVPAGVVRPLQDTRRAVAPAPTEPERRHRRAS